jgi:hypothetical protein
MVLEGHLAPSDRQKRDRGLDRRMYSIADMVRTKVIASAVSDAGLKPMHAVQIADFAMAFFDDIAERDIAHEMVSHAHIIVLSRIREDGKVASTVVYRRPFGWLVFPDNPDLNPDTKPLDLPAQATIITPLTAIFLNIYNDAVQLLVQQNRGAVDKFGRLIGASLASPKASDRPKPVVEYGEDGQSHLSSVSLTKRI